MKHRLTALFVLLLLTAPLVARKQEEKEQRRRAERLQQEETEDYYKKWLEQDVRYIIMEEEEKVFLSLSTDEEREQFIEQFWFRRDPDPRTAENEFKEEHYRRIAYVNEHYGSGIPGWKTDRGRTYITFGPPDIIEDHPSGGWYYRPHHEGGGATSTYPFQLWIYNFIEGLGTEVEIEFVDPSWSGEYRMALEPWEKDALLHVGFMGPTDAELEGSLTKLDRPYFSPGNYRNTRMQHRLGMRAKDKPFERTLRFYRLQEPEPIKFKDLKQLVTTKVIFHQFPFRMGYDFIQIDAGNVLVPITLEFDNRDLTFIDKNEGQVVWGQVNIYGIVESLTGRPITEFEDTLLMEFPASERQTRLQRKSVHQKMLLLPPGRYKLTMAVKDDHSDQVGTLETGLILPAVKEQTLDASSVILARSMQLLETPPQEALPFVLGDFKVIPNVTRSFHNGDDMGIFVHVYNATLDQASLEPEVEVRYEILREGRIVKSHLDPKRNSVLNYGDRIVLLKALDLADLVPGNYTLRVRVHDQVGKKNLSRQVPFSVTG